MPTKWLQGRPNGSKNDRGMPPRKASRGNLASRQRLHRVWPTSATLTHSFTLSHALSHSLTIESGRRHRALPSGTAVGPPLLPGIQRLCPRFRGLQKARRRLDAPIARHLLVRKLPSRVWCSEIRPLAAQVPSTAPYFYRCVAKQAATKQDFV